MDEENQVLAEIAEAGEKDKNLESEDLNFSCQNKEEAKKKLEASMKDMDRMFGSLLQDVPDPSEKEVRDGVAKILERAAADSAQTAEKAEPLQLRPVKSGQSKKVTLKVLLLAALLSILSFSTLFVMGSRHNISIENGFMSFARDTVQVVFFGEDERFISVDSLLEDLKSHGYDDIVFPQEFVTKSDEYKVSVPEYSSDESGKQVSFEVYEGEEIHKFCIHNYNLTNKNYGYNNIGNAQEIMINGINLYIINLNDETTIEFVDNEYYYFIISTVSYSDTLKIVETIR